jgi:hypothetical protein
VLVERYEGARQLCLPGKPPFALYAALLTYPLNAPEKEQLISLLRLDKKTGRVLRESTELREKTVALSAPSLPPAGIYHRLEGYDPLAIQALLIACGHAVVRQRLDDYTLNMQKMKPRLNGKDLQWLGVPEGVEIKKVLVRLLDARLNGEVRDRADEERLVRAWVEGKAQ